MAFRHRVLQRLRDAIDAGYKSAIADALKVTPGSIARWANDGRKFDDAHAKKISGVLALTALHNEIAAWCERITQAEFCRLSTQGGVRLPTSTLSGWIQRGYIPPRSYDYAAAALEAVKRESETKNEDAPEITLIEFATGRDSEITARQSRLIAQSIVAGAIPKTIIRTTIGAIEQRAFGKYRELDAGVVGNAGDSYRREIISDHPITPRGQYLLSVGFLRALRAMLDKIGRADIPICPLARITDRVDRKNSKHAGTNDPAQVWGLTAYVDDERLPEQDYWVYAYRTSKAVAGAYVVEFIEVPNASQYKTELLEVDDEH